MSNRIVYDPLLVHYLAAELGQRLRGRACACAPHFDIDRTVLLPLDRGEALRLDLHPRRGWVRLVPHDADEDELDSVIEGVAAPHDERLLRVEMRAADRFGAQARALVVELHTNQWNAILVSRESGRILSLVWARRAGDRLLHAGSAYVAPGGAARYGAERVARDAALGEWMRLLGAEPPAARRAVLLRHFAYTGTLNVAAVLGAAAREEGDAPLRAAFQRWWALATLPPARPVVLREGARVQPYPLPLPGVASETVGSLLEGMARAAEGAAAPDGGVAGVAFARRRRDAALRRVQRLEAERGRSAEAERMRFWGDLLLARKRLVPRGVSSVRLQDWEGRLVEVPLDPAASAADNATRLYDEARRRERAGERLPELIEAARAEAERWSDAVARAEAGELPEWVLQAAGDPAEVGEPAAVPARPYRRYRTSGGLEVRVGRGARENDHLTFHHAAPNDVWLHARSVPGSHVVLRWAHAEGSPPARDLAEAATLAALFSRARSSALVPVDWTRRKYVRKPRGAAPGTVVPQQVRTLFVEPDPELEERLRVD